MNSVQEALNALIAAVRVAHDKGGVYTLEESHHICSAIYYLDSLKQTSGSDKNESDDGSPKQNTKETQR